MKCCTFRRLAVAVVLALVVGRATAGTEVKCDDAVAQLQPCGAFLKSTAARPNAAPPVAVRSLDKLAKSSPRSRKILCECFKETASSFPVNLVRAAKLPKLCNVTSSIRLDPNLHCNKLSI
ncbi:non-specific lipid-transfer protein-like [Sesamum indicum]|uniref:Non-specific lipid-transfer protein-like n=1 Tax=Sesamum indicum TaxID=4182 RepID=A0A6I9TZT9_SESIN|nr:non-specific lipid-transfer protein-like [Sesamum indicum]